MEPDFQSRFGEPGHFKGARDKEPGNFYNECPVMSAPDEQTRTARIAICIAVRQVLVNLIGLLGIEAPERM